MGRGLPCQARLVRPVWTKRSYMRKLVARVLVIQALVFALCCTSSCSKPDAVGRYALDTEHFAESMATMLIKEGRVPKRNKEKAKTVLRTAVFDLHMKPDRTFRAEYTVGRTPTVYKGTWSLEGTELKLQQTHENDRKRPQTMTGKLDGDQLVLLRPEKQVTVELRLKRVRNGAAPH